MSATQVFIRGKVRLSCNPYADTSPLGRRWVDSFEAKKAAFGRSGHFSPLRLSRLIPPS